MIDDLFARTERGALAGAKIVAWSEAAATLHEEQAQVVARAADLVVQHGVHAAIDDGAAARRGGRQTEE